MNLRPTQAIVLAVAMLALVLVGLPFFLVVDAPLGPRHGLVVDERGFGVEDAAVFLFSARGRRLVEETRTDATGNFSFALDVATPRVLVRPRAADGLLDSWSAIEIEDDAPLEFVLHGGHPLCVRVRDQSGSPLADAEVRVYEARDEPVVVAVARTDAEGTARLSAPDGAHVRVTRPGPALLSRWRLDLRIPKDGLELYFQLPPARLVHGTVLEGEAPLEGIVLVAREDGPDGAWNAFARSDAEGRFELSFSDAPGEILAEDPSGRMLSARLAFALPPMEEIELQLERGLPLTVQTTRNGAPTGARLWSWSPAARTWSWGLRADDSGQTILPVREPFGIHADPLDASLSIPEAWDLMLEEGPLVLEALPAR